MVYSPLEDAEEYSFEELRSRLPQHQIVLQQQQQQQSVSAYQDEELDDENMEDDAWKKNTLTMTMMATMVITCSPCNQLFNLLQ